LLELTEVDTKTENWVNVIYTR